MKKLVADDIFGEQINDYELPLEERFYNSFNYTDFLNDEHFHHSKKGCEIEIVLSKSPMGNIRVNKVCYTHQKECSKTGWELGWYMGTNSRMAWGAGKYTKKCIKCKTKYLAKARNQKYCYKCRKLVDDKKYTKFVAVF